MLLEKIRKLPDLEKVAQRARSGIYQRLPVPVYARELRSRRERPQPWHHRQGRRPRQPQQPLRPAAIDQQTVIRLNRDTLYSAGVFDLDAGPVTITLPNAGSGSCRCRVIDEDEYTPEVDYGAGSHTLTREKIGTRHVLVGGSGPGQPGRSEGNLEAVHTFSGCDQGRPARGAVEVQDGRIGTRRVRRRVRDLASQRSPRLCRTPKGLFGAIALPIPSGTSDRGGLGLRGNPGEGRAPSQRRSGQQRRRRYGSSRLNVMAMAGFDGFGRSAFTKTPGGGDARRQRLRKRRRMPPVGSAFGGRTGRRRIAQLQDCNRSQPLRINMNRVYRLQ